MSQGGIFAPFIPGDLEELKLKELKNGRLAMRVVICSSELSRRQLYGSKRPPNLQL